MRTIEINGETITICRNAFAGESAWFCYFYAGRPTGGKLAIDENERCEACAKAHAGTDSGNLPSWMENED